MLLQVIEGMTVVERYGSLGLLAVVLAGVGAFLWRVGLRIVESVNGLTVAVRNQTAEFRSMAQANADNTRRILEQNEQSTEKMLSCLTRLKANGEGAG